MAGNLVRASPTTEPNAATEPTHPPADGSAIEVHNLGRGAIVEVTVHGLLGAPAVADFRSRLLTLAAKRQPATLRVDLAHATSVDEQAIDALLEAATILDGFGSQLVVCNPDPSFERAIPAQRLGRSLRVEGRRRDPDDVLRT